ncbi:hypothetical protein AGLY_015049 [Aphis glycines]|uniref:Uncharacterized protein n=1 Tax=Aphis glycines TaxID=307491 RepID=A0A6G0T350_APHGL|nr:hypothetical protein AGLY_015049 [Aphis glycines]
MITEIFNTPRNEEYLFYPTTKSQIIRYSMNGIRLYEHNHNLQINGRFSDHIRILNEVMNGWVPMGKLISLVHYRSQNLEFFNSFQKNRFFMVVTLKLTTVNTRNFHQIVDKKILDALKKLENLIIIVVKKKIKNRWSQFFFYTSSFKLKCLRNVSKSGKKLNIKFSINFLCTLCYRENSKSHYRKNVMSSKILEYFTIKILESLIQSFTRVSLIHLKFKYLQKFVKIMNNCKLLYRSLKYKLPFLIANLKYKTSLADKSSPFGVVFFYTMIYLSLDSNLTLTTTTFLILCSKAEIFSKILFLRIDKTLCHSCDIREYHLSQNDNIYKPKLSRDNFMKGDNLIKVLLNTETVKKRKNQLKQISDYNYNRPANINNIEKKVDFKQSLLDQIKCNKIKKETDKFESLKNEKVMQKELLKSLYDERIRNIEARNRFLPCLGGGWRLPDTVTCPKRDTARDRNSNRRRCASQPTPKNARPLRPPDGQLSINTKNARNNEIQKEKEKNIDFERSLLDKLKEKETKHYKEKKLSQKKFLKEEINKLLNMSETERSKNKVPGSYISKINSIIHCKNCSRIEQPNVEMKQYVPDILLLRIIPF